MNNNDFRYFVIIKKYYCGYLKLLKYTIFFYKH